MFGFAPFSNLQKWALSLLLLLLWFPSTSHCLLEHAEFWRGESCCEKHEKTESIPFKKDCTACGTLGAGHFVKPASENFSKELTAAGKDDPTPCNYTVAASPLTSHFNTNQNFPSSLDRQDGLNRCEMLRLTRIHPIRGPDLSKA